MRTFEDRDGRTWTADVRETPGPDYKGRWVLVLSSAGFPHDIALPEVRWNSAHAAGASLLVMSQAELRRRVRAAAGRA